MFKRLMIGLFALSLAAIWISEANAITSRRARSVGVTVQYTYPSDQTGSSFTTGIYGLPAEESGCACGEVRGRLYCATEDSDLARLACQARSGDSAALVVALDPDAIPDFFTPDDYNFNLKAFGQRLELYYFKNHFGETPPATISLPVGDTKKKAGWFVITDNSFSLRNYVGNWNKDQGKFIPADGYGINGEQYVEDVALAPYYAGNAADLEEKTICAVWHHDQIKGDTLHGNYYGLAAFKTHHYNASSKTMEVEILSAYDVCGGPLYNDPNAGTASSEYSCNVAEAVVFAPAPITINDKTYPEKDTFPKVSGEISCTSNGIGYDCYGTAPVELDGDTGLQLCQEKFGAESYFATFIPINNNCGNNAFTGYLKFKDEGGVYETVKCGQSTGSAQYQCESFSPLPDCFGCGQQAWKYGESVSCDECPAE